MLTGWSDGHTFIPVDFSLLSSLNSQVNGISEKIDKRTSAYKRRLKSILKLIKSQLQNWIAGLPSYIKAYLPELCCES